jgi:microcystin-dependent protein
MDGYLGEIKMFAGTYAPECWEFCWGQLLNIQEYQSLYAILGVQFGGNGQTTFGIPDLRGRVPVGSGSGPGLSSRVPGQMGGLEHVTLTVSQIPAHNHSVKCDITSQDRDLSNTPQDNLPAKPKDVNGYGKNETGNPMMKADMLNNTGSSQPHENMPPWGCLNYIICVQGQWPPRS